MNPTTTLKTKNIIELYVPNKTILPFSNIIRSIWIRQNTKTVWNSVLNFTFISWVDFFISKILIYTTRRSFPLIKSYTFSTTNRESSLSNHRRRKKKEGDEDEDEDE